MIAISNFYLSIENVTRLGQSELELGLGLNGVTRAAEKRITHQSDLAVYENKVDTKLSTNQKL